MLDTLSQIPYPTFYNDNHQFCGRILMAEKLSFECVECGNITEIDEDDPNIPACCGKPMQAEGLDACQTSSTAEHSRFDDLGEPCDDGRSG